VYRVFPTRVIDELIGRESCGFLKVPEKHKTDGVFDYDLVVYVGDKYAIRTSYSWTI
jgi:hypothetical protein